MTRLFRKDGLPLFMGGWGEEEEEEDDDEGEKQEVEVARSNPSDIQAPHSSSTMPAPTLPELTVRPRYPELTVRPRLCTYSDSDSDSSDDWYETPKERFRRMEIEVTALTTNGILKKPGRTNEPSKSAPRRQVKFKLDPDKEKLADRPYRETYEMVRAARRERKGKGKKTQVNKPKETEMDEYVWELGNKYRKNMDTKYLEEWQQYLQNRFKEEYNGSDPRFYWMEPYTFLKEGLEPLPEPKSSRLPSDFARNFKRLVYAPGKRAMEPIKLNIK